jgi:alkanesulfonate monooxygenase SsuD/methylene tetrahydromethanopterin reductase-like flavin-dependent oxidoreductase (luciferase family)
MHVIASWPSQMELREVGPWARRVEAMGFDAMHVPEVTHDPFTVAALALTHTDRLIDRCKDILSARPAN